MCSVEHEGNRRLVLDRDSERMLQCITCGARYEPLPDEWEKAQDDSYIDRQARRHVSERGGEG